MGRFFTMIYWSAAVPLVALVLWSAMGSLGSAMFLSVLLLPGVLFFKYFAPGISFKNRRQGILHTIYFVAIVMLVEYLGIAFFYASNYEWPFTEEMPRIVTNPLFLWLLLGALLSIEYLLRSKLVGAAVEPEKFITFTSGRKKVSLELDSITCIESRDYEVVVRTADGAAYPTRMKISQWESVLDDRFVRTHRSFIVNRRHITRFDGHTVRLGNLDIEISRKYREGVLEKLEKASG